MPGFDLPLCLTRLTERNPGKTEADLQAEVRDLLLYGGFDLGEEHVRLESPTDDRRRIDVEVGALVIECKRDLRKAGVLSDGQTQLRDYLAGRIQGQGRVYVGILTDGTSWRLYHLTDGNQLSHVTSFELAGPDDSQRFRWWLGAILATEQSLRPTAEAITARLGNASPFFQVTMAELTTLWARGSSDPTIALKRALWAKLLSTALGTQFRDEDELFIEHTYLVLLGTFVWHAVVGIDLRSHLGSPAALLTGQLFTNAGISGIGEAGFFDWPLEVDDGDRFLERIIRQVVAFDWHDVDHDVLKSLYQSVIARVTRHDLGEYYTPDWLAQAMVESVIDQPLSQRVLDPACGSGTFLFHAVRHYLTAAEDAAVPTSEALGHLADHVIGFDLHPVAVVLAQVTYLLAIGNTRLQERSGSLRVPVYLGDSLHWDETGEPELQDEGQLVIRTDEGRLFAADLRFPFDVVDDPGRFDDLVSAMTDLATSRARGSRRRDLTPLLRRFGFSSKDQDVLRDTYATLCELHDDGRNHVWGFYIRNQARPAWLAKEANQVDVLLGNPPWLAYRYMPSQMQQRFRARSRARNLWSGRQVATQQDLSAFFVVRSVELFLKPSGKFGFVMPRAVVSRQAYGGFRSGRYILLNVDFDKPWELGEIRPQPFLVPSAVVFGRKLSGVSSQKSLPSIVSSWSGDAGIGQAWSDVKQHISKSDLNIEVVNRDISRSPYSRRFRNGAFLVPRMLVFVDDVPAPPFGLPQGQHSVQSHRSLQEKVPWRDLPSIAGVVEDILIRPVHLGETVLPFRTLEPLRAVIPHDGKKLLDTAALVGRYNRFSQWWEVAENVWVTNRGSRNSKTLIEQLNYLGKLASQFPSHATRVVYTKAGNTLAAATVSERQAVIDHKLYWAAVSSPDEARYLTAILNSSVLGDIVRPYQSVGAFGPRDFDKYVWYAPIPEFNAGNKRHSHLVELAKRAEAVAASVALPDGAGFQRARRLIRTALRDTGTAAAMDAVVTALLTKRA